YVWPGNPAMATVAEIADFNGSADFAALASFCREAGVNVVVVGPEGPLDSGIADVLTAKGGKVFGPNAKLARLESSKAFAKEIMQSAKIPTAHFQLVKGLEETRSAASDLLTREKGVVLKASGLAAGKGVFVCQSSMEVEAALERLFSS